LRILVFALHVSQLNCCVQVCLDNRLWLGHHTTHLHAAVYTFFCRQNGFASCQCVQVYLDSLLPQLVALAEGDGSRARRVAAYEALHSIALWLVGNMAQTSQQREFGHEAVCVTACVSALQVVPHGGMFSTYSQIMLQVWHAKWAGGLGGLQQSCCNNSSFSGIVADNNPKLSLCFAAFLLQWLVLVAPSSMQQPANMPGCAASCGLRC
jgi:hypothetical protein